VIFQEKKEKYLKDMFNELETHSESNITDYTEKKNYLRGVTNLEAT
jgi:hypothetical protein